MNYDSLKNLYERMPYFFKMPFAGMIRNKLIGNKIFTEQYSSLFKFDKATNQEIAEQQFILLKDTLIHAYEHTKYYKKLFDEIGFEPYKIQDVSELSTIPILTKEILQDSFDDLNADDIKNSYTVTTGGTSGKPTTVLMANKAFYKEWAFIYHYWEKYGYDYKKSRLATFRGLSMGRKISLINPMYQEIRMNPFLMSRNNIDLYIKKIQRYRADFIYGYPSVIFNFCKLAKERGIYLGGQFKAVFCISENLYSFQEEMIQKTLNCPVAIFYGHSERAVFAERAKDGYVFNPFYGIVELSQKGEPIVTGFINPQMPLIRYIVDDHVSVKNNAYIIEGHRSLEVLCGINGEEISAAAINFHSDVFEKASGYQLYQTRPGYAQCWIKKEDNLSIKDLDEIKKAFNMKCGGTIQWEIKVVDAFRLTSRGKFKLIINKCINDKD